RVEQLRGLAGPGEPGEVPGRVGGGQLARWPPAVQAERAQRRPLGGEQGAGHPSGRIPGRIARRAAGRSDPGGAGRAGRGGRAGGGGWGGGDGWAGGGGRAGEGGRADRYGGGRVGRVVGGGRGGAGVQGDVRGQVTRAVRHRPHRPAVPVPGQR